MEDRDEVWRLSLELLPLQPTRKRMRQRMMMMANQFKQENADLLGILLQYRC